MQKIITSSKKDEIFDNMVIKPSLLYSLQSWFFQLWLMSVKSGAYFNLFWPDPKLEQSFIFLATKFNDVENVTGHRIFKESNVMEWLKQNSCCRAAGTGGTFSSLV